MAEAEGRSIVAIRRWRMPRTATHVTSPRTWPRFSYARLRQPFSCQSRPPN